jgi:hypothetical protein
VLLLVEASVLDDVRRLNFLRRVNARGMAADLMVLRHVPAGAKAEGATGPVVDLPAELHPEELIMEGRSGPSLRRLAHELVRRTRGRLRRQLAEWLLAGSQAVEARLLLTAAVGIARQQRVTGKQLAGDLGWRREKLWECCVAEFGLSAREVIDLVNMVAVGPPMSTGAYPPQVVAQAFGWSKKGSVIGLFRRVTGEPPPESDGTTGGGRVTAELLEAWLLRGWGERDGREP